MQKHVCTTTALILSLAAGKGYAQSLGELIQGLDSPDTLVQEQSANLLNTFTGDGPEAAQTLVLSIGETADEFHPIIVNALGRLGSQAVDDLTMALSSEESEVRRAAAQALDRIGPSAAPAAEELGNLLTNDPVEPVRGAAAEALRSIGPAASGEMGQLAEALNDKSQWVRCIAVEALGNFGAEASQYADRVETLILNDPDIYVREQAQLSLANIQSGSANNLFSTNLLSSSPLPELAISVRELRREIQIGTVEDRSDAAAALGQAYLNSLAISDQGFNLLQSVEGLGDNVEPLDVVAHRPTPKVAALVRGQAIEAMRDLGEDSIYALPYLIMGLSDDMIWIRAVSAETLGNIGSQASAGVPDLAELLNDDSEYVRATAGEALQEILSTPTSNQD